LIFADSLRFLPTVARSTYVRAVKSCKKSDIDLLNKRFAIATASLPEQGARSDFVEIEIKLIRRTVQGQGLIAEPSKLASSGSKEIAMANKFCTTIMC
jgi:hypothetical protein